MEENKSSDALLKEIEKLHEELKRVREDIDQSYYSIPKKEFESITVKKITQDVTEEVNRRMTAWRNVAGLLILILSFLGITQFREYTKEFRDDIKEKMGDLSSRTRKDIELIETKLDSAVGNKIGLHFKEEFQGMKNEMEKIHRDTQKTADAFFTSAEVTDLKNEIESIEKMEKENRITYKDAINRLKPLLNKPFAEKDRKLFSIMLDDLFRWTYQAGLYEDMDDLRQKYEGKYEFVPSVWANIEIADMFLYDETGSQTYKKRALDAYDKAIQSLPNYGLPHAVRLIIHMIDYEREREEKKRMEEKNEALNLFTRVNSGSRNLVPCEAYDWLTRAEKIDVTKKYVKDLVDNFPGEMLLMKEKYEKYLEYLPLQKT